MMNIKMGIKVLTVAGILSLSLASVAPAMADNSVNQEVTCPGTPALTAVITDKTLTAVTFSQSEQQPTGSLLLNVSDSTCLGTGWNVTVQTSAFAYTGSGSGSAIPAANLLLGTPASPVFVSGQDTPGLPAAVGTGGTLNSAIKVIMADANNGMGSYTQSLPVTLTIPARSVAGTYTATLTVTKAAVPGA